MKTRTISLLIIAILPSFGTCRIAYAAQQNQCLSDKACLDSLPLNPGYVCCQTGQTGQEYSCPDGYRLNGTTCKYNTGTVQTTTKGEDSVGYYEITTTSTYPDCNATSKTFRCHAPASEAPNGVFCLSPDPSVVL